MRAVISLLIVAAVLLALFVIGVEKSRECEARGGVLVRAFIGYACVKELP